MARGKHIEFLNSVLLENLDSEKSIDEVKLQCKDGELYLTKFLVGFVFGELRNSLEFSLSLCDLILLPLHSCEELIDFLNRCLQYDKSVESKETDEDALYECQAEIEDEEKPDSELIEAGSLHQSTPVDTQEEFQCEVCKLVLNTKHHLTEHRRTCRAAFKCQYCPEGFQSEDDLMKHVATKHFVYHLRKVEKRGKRKRGRRGKFECTVCGKTYDYQKKLDLHCDVHIKPFSCSECELSFSNKIKLSVHKSKAHNLVANTDENLHQCEECDKVFTAPSMLKRHMTTHTKDRPFTCTECGKGFSIQHNLRVHERIHLGTSKIYKCRYPPCDRKFSHTRERQDHEGIHTGDKPFSCNYCGQSYQRHSNLWKHRKKCALEHQFSQHLERLKENFEPEEPEPSDMKEIHVLSLEPDTQIFEVDLEDVAVEHII